MPRKKTLKEFIADAIRVHGNQYDYSKVEYRSGRNKVIIVCDRHGLFTQEAQSHLSGVGCPDCGSVKKAAALSLTTAEFIKRSKMVHGEKYDYSKSNFSGTKVKLIIACEIHGDFLQAAGHHMRGLGCNECALEIRANKKRKPLSVFIEESNSLHQGKYSYAKVVYKNTSEKVEILCPIHGVFFQSPEAHQRGQGCPICGVKKFSMAQSFTTAEFISRAREKHNDKFDYSRVIYERSQSSVEILCPKHGVFKQKPASHLRGSGCKKCADENNGVLRRRSFENFVLECRKVHGDTYAYPDQEYKGGDFKLEIVCKKHGSFYQRGESHLLGMRCVKCAKQEAGLSRRATTKSFRRRAKSVHGERYDYGKSTYQLSGVKLDISCPQHGLFQQTPAHHLSGQGCPGCADEVRNLGNTIASLKAARREIDGQLYVVELFSEEEHFFKIGITTQSLRRRFESISKIYDYDVIALIGIDLIKAYESEQATLKSLSSYRYQPQHYFGGITECLSVDPIEYDPYLADLVERFSLE